MSRQQRLQRNRKMATAAEAQEDKELRDMSITHRRFGSTLLTKLSGNDNLPKQFNAFRQPKMPDVTVAPDTRKRPPPEPSSPRCVKRRSDATTIDHTPPHSPQSTPPTLKGFINTGNTCYMNAALSCILHLPTFSDAILSTNRLYTSRKQFDGIIPFLACCVQGIASGGVVGLKPESLKHEISKRKKIFQGNDQQDAHEFLISLLELLHYEVLAVGLKQKTTDEPQEEKTTLPESISLVRRLTEGTISKQLTCSQCDNSDTIIAEPFSILSLSLKSERKDICIEGCLTKVFKEEVLTRTCTQCDSEECVAAAVITTLPHYLFLHVNRFLKESYGITKDDSAVTVHGGLDMRRFCGSEVCGAPCDALSFTSNGSLRSRRPMNPLLHPSSTHYSLCSIVDHHGLTVSSGHYTTTFRGPTGDWFKADDSNVRPTASPLGLASQTCYILVYERCPDPNDD
eukprot:TRINITY_DN22283_c0_g1_i1.p1 TRINITY_DN22283_c0_g1~~TRINITY_DN22283_c0_g1_i1.p1  ORF type:complete len:456 (+),score=40.11 TRINITY_DN22283_c0_g1_i1:71-1438(+)